MHMATPAISEILMTRQGVYLCCAHDPESTLLPALAEALREHAQCVHCGRSPRPDFKPCRCERSASTPFSYFDFRIELDVWREVVEPLWRKDLRRIHSRNSYERRKEAIDASWEPSYTTTDIDCLREAQKDACYYCGRSILADAQIEHLEPLSRGGSNGFANIMLACAACNSAKGVLSERQFWKRLQKELAPAQFDRLREAAKSMKREKWRCHRNAVARERGTDRTITP